MNTGHLMDSSPDRAVDELGWQTVGPRLPPVKQKKINGSNLTYIEQGEGELVIFVHGALGDCRTWARQVALLAQHYHVISYSRRYHHRKPAPEGIIDYSYGRHVDDLISLIRTLQLGPAHLVGHSCGATVAALVALERPDMVSSLVLGEPSLFSVLSDSQDRVSLRLHRIALRVVQKLSENDEPGLAVPNGSYDPATVFLVEDGRIQRAPSEFSHYVGMRLDLFLLELRPLSRGK